eukprot:6214229-Pleurochrysis_carterae.AAC.2
MLGYSSATIGEYILLYKILWVAQRPTTPTWLQRQVTLASKSSLASNHSRHYFLRERDVAKQRVRLANTSDDGGHCSHLHLPPRRCQLDSRRPVITASRLAGVPFVYNYINKQEFGTAFAVSLAAFPHCQKRRRPFIIAGRPAGVPLFLQLRVIALSSDVKKQLFGTAFAVWLAAFPHAS